MVDIPGYGPEPNPFEQVEDVSEVDDDFDYNNCKSRSLPFVDQR